MFKAAPARLLVVPRARPAAHASLRRHATPARAAALTFEERMENGLVKTLDETRVARVLASLRRTSEGHEFSKDWPDKGRQEANSYIEGLSATPWHDTAAPEYEWARTLEDNWEMIAKELSVALQQKPQVQPEAATSEWVAAVREDALAYGPEWRTLVLQDRGRWDDERMRLFPKTVKLLQAAAALDDKLLNVPKASLRGEVGFEWLQKLDVPSSEVFFARQSPKTGIKPHTDNTNFILTGHLGLIIPEGDCWIKVGNERRSWREGEAMIMDTSFLHETFNDTDGSRYVLIFRFWHPELTEDEKNALLYVFDCLDLPENVAIKEAQKRLQKRLKAKQSRAAQSKGFGAR